ncbi:hypothetical protein NI343_003496 [Salmonella enterica]|nr:hypothetical protein [Salmonella enterica]EJJ4373978.1 hypothetical protein [Salmonella enterica]EKB5296921.1 hypothetical protein [Salmonella enterica]EKC2468872.1 hypothetical protein [Salmonella enterica]EKC2480734.1 hypothetical protein [Salmonella enterica]
MKVLSYSRMRAELADVLDCLRNGETVTITQKGKDDLVLYSDKGQININTRLSGSSGIASTIEMVDRVDKVTGRGLRMSELNQLYERTGLKVIKDLEALNPALQKKGPGMSFEEAKKKVSERHSEVIKGLENN